MSEYRIAGRWKLRIVRTARTNYRLLTTTQEKVVPEENLQCIART